MIYIKEKAIVTPGEILAKGLEYIPGQGCYRDNEKIVAKVVGIVTLDKKVIKVTPLSGRYIPKKGDIIIGRVVDISLNGWRVDINSPYMAMLLTKDATTRFIKREEDLSKIIDIDDYIIAKIKNVSGQNLVDLSMNGEGLKKITNGIVIRVSPVKVPRIIGTRGSMISMIKKATKCDIVVGYNGVIWINGDVEKEILAINAIRKIEREAHTSGLTDKIKNLLEGKNV